MLSSMSLGHDDVISTILYHILSLYSFLTLVEDFKKYFFCFCFFDPTSWKIAGVAECPCPPAGGVVYPLGCIGPPHGKLWDAFMGFFALFQPAPQPSISPLLWRGCRITGSASFYLEKIWKKWLGFPGGERRGFVSTVAFIYFSLQTFIFKGTMSRQGVQQFPGSVHTVLLQASGGHPEPINVVFDNFKSTLKKALIQSPHFSTRGWRVLF